MRARSLAASLAMLVVPGAACGSRRDLSAYPYEATAQSAPAPAPGSPAAGAARCAPKCAPVVVGHVGTYTGAFASFANAPEGVRAWGQAVNARAASTAIR